MYQRGDVKMLMVYRRADFGDGKESRGTKGCCGVFVT